MAIEAYVLFTEFCTSWPMDNHSSRTFNTPKIPFSDDSFFSDGTGFAGPSNPAPIPDISPDADHDHSEGSSS